MVSCVTGRAEAEGESDDEEDGEDVEEGECHDGQHYSFTNRWWYNLVWTP